MSAIVENKTALTNLQLELLKSLKHMASEEQVAEVKSLLRYYFAQKLNSAIDKVEKEKNYSAAVYESWLKSITGNDNSVGAA
jgi:predicted RecB family endonuclease